MKRLAIVMFAIVALSLGAKAIRRSRPEPPKPLFSLSTSDGKGNEVDLTIGPGGEFSLKTSDEHGKDVEIDVDHHKRVAINATVNEADDDDKDDEEDEDDE